MRGIGTRPRRELGVGGCCFASNAPNSKGLHLGKTPQPQHCRRRNGDYREDLRIEYERSQRESREHQQCLEAAARQYAVGDRKQVDRQREHQQFRTPEKRRDPRSDWCAQTERQTAAVQVKHDRGDSGSIRVRQERTRIRRRGERRDEKSIEGKQCFCPRYEDGYVKGIDWMALSKMSGGGGAKCFWNRQPPEQSVGSRCGFLSPEARSAAGGPDCAAQRNAVGSILASKRTENVMVEVTRS